MAKFLKMSTADVATFKAHADELIVKAIAVEATVIEHNGKHAILLPCEGTIPDSKLDPEADRLLQDRARAPGPEPAAADWAAMRTTIPQMNCR